jgi:hypothetical protein
MRRRIMIVVGAAVLAAAFASTAMATHTWGSYHWARTSGNAEVPLKVGDNVGTTWDSYLDGAIADWNASSVISLTKVVGGANNKNCRPTSGRIEVCSGNYGNNGWLGLATIWTVSGTTHIGQATTKVNDTYFNSAIYNNPNERKHVMCQEVAHDFGLDHQSESGADLNTCMDYFSNTGANANNTDSTHPNAGDYDELQWKYDPSFNGPKTSGTHTTQAGTAGHYDSSNSWSKTETGVIARPGSENVLVSHHGRFTKITVVRYANPIH